MEVNYTRREHIDYNHTERVTRIFTFPAGSGTVLNKKYSFGYNFNVDKARTKKITWFEPGAVVSPTVVINGVLYIVTDLYSYTLVTIAKRGGDYYCIDMPLATLLRNATGSFGHYQMEVDNWEVDLTNSYVKFLQVAGGRFVINFDFELQPQ
jgi:hypothetical protein